MRKRRPALYYRQRTREIVNRTFQPWQLIVRDPREGMHRLINRIVSLADDLQHEARYVESMFFPDSCDLSEPYLAYTVSPACPPENILVSGEALSSFLREADSFDTFLAGPPTAYRTHAAHKVVAHTALSMTHSSEIYLIGESGAVYQYDAYTGAVRTIRQPMPPDQKSYSVIIDTNRSFVIYDKCENITVTAPSGIGLPFDILTEHGNYNPDFDIDKNGVIGDVERHRAMQAYGARMEDVPLEMWNQIGWCDIDGDGYISEQDIRIVTASIPSFDPAATCAVTVRGNYRGEAIITYTLTQDIPTTIMADVMGTSPAYTIPDDLKESIAVSYDTFTGIYYAIDNPVQLRAVKVHPSLGSVVADYLISVPLSASGELLDVDVCNGVLYVLSRDANAYALYEVYVHDEYPVVTEAPIPIDVTIRPTMLGVGSDGAIVVSDGTTLAFLSPERGYYIGANNTTYLGMPVSGAVSTDGKALTCVPYTIFNNFDSFAFSLGLIRPYGRDNVWMRDAIYDFFRHRQGNTPIGITYGVMRQCGVIPETYYSLPVLATSVLRLACNQPCKLNGNPVIIESSGGLYSIASDIFSAVTQDGQHWIIYGISGECVLEGKVYDGNGDLRDDSIVFIQPSGTPYSQAPLVCLQGDNLSLLSDLQYYSGEVLTSSGIEAISRYAQSEPTIWANCVTDCTPVKALRASIDPVMPTVFGESYVATRFPATGEVFV